MAKYWKIISPSGHTASEPLGEQLTLMVLIWGLVLRATVLSTSEGGTTGTKGLTIGGFSYFHHLFMWSISTNEHCII